MNKELFARLTIYSILVISAIHIIGYIDLMGWLYFSGIGEEATMVQNKFGYTGLFLLNLSAILMFIIIAMVYRYRSSHWVLKLGAHVITIVFVIRGLGGIVMSFLGTTGSSTLFWATTFSLIALAVGIFAYLGLEGEL